MEMIDIYDVTRQWTGRTQDKHIPLEAGEYRQIVELWVQNDEGEFLIQQRANTKTLFPGKWYCTVAGGSVAGETPIDTCIRESQEELGLQLEKENGQLFGVITEEQVHFYIFLFRQSVDISALALEPYEVADVQWASVENIRQMIADDAFISLEYYPAFFEFASGV